MATKEVASGVVHDIPSDIKKVVTKDASLLDLWNGLTPLARNEWICWVTIVKQQKTRDEHLVRLEEDLRKGKKRPCCWPGCPHRNEKAKKWFK